MRRNWTLTQTETFFLIAGLTYSRWGCVGDVAPRGRPQIAARELPHICERSPRPLGTGVAQDDGRAAFKANAGQDRHYLRRLETFAFCGREIGDKLRPPSPLMEEMPSEDEDEAGSKSDKKTCPEHTLTPVRNNDVGRLCCTAVTARRHTSSLPREGSPFCRLAKQL